MAKKFNIAAFYFLAEDGSKMPLGGLTRWGKGCIFSHTGQRLRSDGLPKGDEAL